MLLLQSPMGLHAADFLVVFHLCVKSTTVVFDLFVANCFHRGVFDAGVHCMVGFVAGEGATTELVHVRPICGVSLVALYQVGLDVRRAGFAELFPLLLCSCWLLCAVGATRAAQLPSACLQG